MRPTRFLVLALVVLSSLIGCSNDSIGPESPQIKASISPDGGIQLPAADWGCPTCDPDPSPLAPGIWLGYRNTPGRCFLAVPGETGSGDVDHDAMVDSCEEYVSYAFRPMLRTTPGDLDLSRESYWQAFYCGAVVNCFTGGGWEARIIYLLGYHEDNGDNNGCPEFAGFGWCNGHPGDSEFVVLDVHYNAVTQHWELYNAFLSAHYNDTGDSSAWATASAFSYPETSLGYPRVWVSLDKHGNYASQSDCEDGGTLNEDTCAGGLDSGRFEVPSGLSWASGNIGSARVKFKDQVSSVTGLGTGTEYFWSDIRFCGWDAYAATYRPNCSTSYASNLSTFR